MKQNPSNPSSSGGQTDTAETRVAKDPVCGMSVNPHLAAAKETHAGRTYYFCGTGCLEKFHSQPERFVIEKPDSRKAADRHSSTGKYTCPMHPELRQLGTGSCPKCGMALEPVSPAPATQKIEYTCPMHPQIVRSEPGNCPICGMALEPRTISLGAEEENPELRSMTRRFWLSVVLTVPVLMPAMADYLPGRPLERLASARQWIWFELILVGPGTGVARTQPNRRGNQSLIRALTENSAANQ
jgi:Cu+-exporting ATPase